MRKRIVAVTALLLYATLAYAQEWRWLYPYPTPNHIQDFSFISENTGFLITDNYELLKTSDGGITWSNVTMNEINMRKIFFLDDTHGWILGWVGSGYSSKAYIIFTDNGGTTWTSYDVSSSIGSFSYYNYSSDMFFISPQTGWIVGENGKVKKTSNGGLTWIDKSIGNSSYDLFFIHFSDMNNGIVIGQGNSGFCFAITSDGGNSWQNRLSSISNNLYGACYETSGNYYVLGQNGIILKTNNLGKMWCLPSETSFEDLHDIYFSNQFNGWAIGDNGTFLKSVDGGETWQELILGISSEFKKIEFLNGNIGWILGNRGSSSLSKQVLLQTIDGGSTWKNMFRSFDERLTFTDVGFSSSKNGWLISSEDNVYSTNDGGIFWGAPKRSSSSEDYYALSVVDSTTVYVVGKKYNQGLVLKTTNAGQTWSTKTIGTSSEFAGVYFIDDNNGWVVGSNGTILHTSNGANTWEIQSSNTTNGLSDVFFIDQNNGWVIGSIHTVLRTADGGLNWILSAFSDNVNLYSIFFLDAKNGWLGTYNGLYRSVDGGDKWTKITLPSSSYNSIYDIYFKDVNTGWILTYYYGNSKIYKTMDGGDSWQEELFTTDNLLDFCFIPDGTGWVVGENSTIASYNSNISSAMTKNGSNLLPSQFTLYQNYPNPFNSSTVIEYDLPKTTNVKLVVYDLLGREIKSLVNRQQEAGKHSVNLDINELTTGTYFYKIQTKDFSQSKKLIILK